MVDMSVRIGSLELKNPVMTASGTFGYGTEYSGYYDIAQLGGLVTKTITLSPREGNPMPRIAETPCGMLNSIGLANVGVDRFMKEKLPILADLDTKVIVNIAGSTIDEYESVSARLQNESRIDGLEVNISCPNVKRGGLAFGTDPKITREVVARIRGTTNKPIITKLTPNVTDIVSIAEAAVDGGSDALALINTVMGMAVDVETFKPVIARKIAGLSGPAIKPIAIAKVYQVAQRISVPIIGIGGIMNWKDALEFFIVGAAAVEIGTLNFIEPDSPMKVLKGLEKYCINKNIKKITDLMGRLVTD